MLTEIKSFLIGHKDLRSFGLLNPCLYVPAAEHLGESIRDWLEWRPLGAGASPVPHSPEKGPGLVIQQLVVLAVGLGRDGHYLLIVFGTYCVILEELKGTYQPFIEI